MSLALETSEAGPGTRFFLHLYHLEMPAPSTGTERRVLKRKVSLCARNEHDSAQGAGQECGSRTLPAGCAPFPHLGEGPLPHLRDGIPEVPPEAGAEPHLSPRTPPPGRLPGTATPPGPGSRKPTTPKANVPDCMTALTVPGDYAPRCTAEEPNAF